MDFFPKAFTTLLGDEGGYVDDERDSGGATKAGITQATWERNGHSGPVRNATYDQIMAIYRDEYWEGAGIDLITPIYPNVGYEVFEAGVLSGPGRAGRWLQRYINLNNDGGRLYPDISADGVVGPNTISALRSYARHRGSDGEDVALIGLNSFQGEFLLRLAEQRPKDEAFVYGWLKMRASIDRPMSDIPGLPEPSRREFHEMVCRHVSI